MKRETDFEISKLIKRARIEKVKAFCSPTASQRNAHNRESERCYKLAKRLESIGNGRIETRAAEVDA